MKLKRWRTELRVRSALGVTVAVLLGAGVLAVPVVRGRDGRHTESIAQLGTPPPEDHDTAPLAGPDTPDQGDPSAAGPARSGPAPPAGDATTGRRERRSTPGPATTIAGAKPIAAAGAGYPGVGSAAALANPNCDRATGRIRYPSVYAPPCVAQWPSGADNGGETAPGVSPTKIKVLVYFGSAARTSDDEQRRRDQWRKTFDTYDSHFELWGRRTELVFFVGSGSDEVAQRSDALKVATDVRPFLSTTAQESRSIFSAELAARSGVNVDSRMSWRDSQLQAPYRWSTEVHDRTATFHVTEFAGKRLAGRPARWAGDAALRGETRVFGLVYPETWDKATFDEQASKRKVPIADALAYDPDNTVGFQERARVQVSRLKARGVTTVIAATDSIYTIILTQAATSQLWFPEWMVTGWGLQDTNLFARLYDQQQWRNAFGLGPIAARVPPEKQEVETTYEWHHGGPAEDSGVHGSANHIARFLFLGLHLAGPNLTAATFRDGMFAFPPSGGAWCQCVTHFGVSFGRRPPVVPWDDYSGRTDFTEVWWDPNEEGPDEAGLLTAPGMYQRVDGGRRYDIGQWPTADAKAFDGRGAVALYDDYPPAEQPPVYEHADH